MSFIPRLSSLLHLFFVALLCIVFTSGCALRSKKAAPKPIANANGSQMHFDGTVSLVNEESRFVLIEAGYSQAPSDGTLLKSFHGETESADLSVSPERHRPFVIADIVRGNPQKGDRVILAKAAAPKAPDHSAPEAPALVQ